MNAAEPQGYYAASAKPRTEYPSLSGNQNADLCIIGAGYTGLSAALHAARAGARAVVLESEMVGFGASGRNGGQIHSGHRIEQSGLEKWLGTQHARDLWNISEGAKGLVRKLAADHAPDCELKSGLLVAAHDRAALRALASEAEHLEKHYDCGSLRMLDADGVVRSVGTAVYPGGRFDADGGHLHPLKLARGLAAGATRAGARIHERTRAINIEVDKDRVRVHTPDGQVEADKVLL